MGHVADAEEERRLVAGEDVPRLVRDGGHSEGVGRRAGQRSPEPEANSLPVVLEHGGRRLPDAAVDRVAARVLRRRRVEGLVEGDGDRRRVQRLGRDEGRRLAVRSEQGVFGARGAAVGVRRGAEVGGLRARTVGVPAFQRRVGASPRRGVGDHVDLGAPEHQGHPIPCVVERWESVQLDKGDVRVGRGERVSIADEDGKRSGRQHQRPRNGVGRGASVGDREPREVHAGVRPVDHLDPLARRRLGRRGVVQDLVDHHVARGRGLGVPDSREHESEEKKPAHRWGRGRP